MDATTTVRRQAGTGSGCPPAINSQVPNIKRISETKGMGFSDIAPVAPCRKVFLYTTMTINNEPERNTKRMKRAVCDEFLVPSWPNNEWGVRTSAFTQRQKKNGRTPVHGEHIEVTT